jgi:hypothetical protein
LFDEVSYWQKRFRKKKNPRGQAVAGSNLLATGGDGGRMGEVDRETHC